MATLWGIPRPAGDLKQWTLDAYNWIIQRTRLKNKTSAYTVEEDVFHVRADATSGAFQVTIPAALNRHGRQILVTKIDSSANAVTVGRTSTDTFDSATSITLSSQWDSVLLVSNGVSVWDRVTTKDADLVGLADLSTTGVVVRTGSGTYTTRTITGTANQITVADGNGVSANPTISLPSTLVAPGSVQIISDLQVDGDTVLGDTASDTVVIGHGTTEAIHPAFTPRVQQHGTGSAGSTMANANWGNSGALPSRLVLFKSRSGTIGTFGVNTVVSNSDLGAIDIVSDDGTDAALAAQLIWEADGDHGTGDVPTRLSVRLSPDGSETPTDVFVFKNDGRIYGTALHNNAGAITGTTNQFIASGTYTPTLTNVTNLSASTAYECQYIRVGNVVTVSGKVDVDPTAAAATALGISLPIASNLGAQEDCAGAAFASGIAGQGAAIRGDAANNRADMAWVAVDLTNQPMYFTFTYTII